MAHTTLEACIAKLDRANEVLASLKAEWQAFLDSHPYPSLVHENPDSGWVNVHLDFSEPAPLRLSVLAGEVAHELRTTLDYMVFALAIKYLERLPTEQEARKISFPVASSPEDFKNAETLGFLSKDAERQIEEAQPYHGADGPQLHPLGFLHWFNRLDKHRAVHASAAFPEPYSIEGLIHWNAEAYLLEKLILLIPRGLREGQTEVARLRFKPWDPLARPKPDVRVKGDLPMDVVFGDLDPEGHPGAFDAGTLGGVETLVRLVILNLSTLL